MGTPVVATGHGGILDIVQPGKTGFLFSPGNVEELAASIVESRTRDLYGLRDFVRNRFTLDGMVKRTLEVYQQGGTSKKQPASDKSFI